MQERDSRGPGWHMNRELRMMDIEDFLTLALRRYVAFDLETTGLYPQRDRITEIGAVRVEYGRETDRFQTLVNPGMPIPQKVQELTHITDDMVREAPTEAEALPEFLEFIGDAPYVAHNATFDVAFLKAACERLALPLPVLSADSLEAANRYWPRMPSHRLGDMAREIGFDLVGAHRSLADTEALAALVNEAVRRNRLSLRANRLYTPCMEVPPGRLGEGSPAVARAVYLMELDLGARVPDAARLRRVPCREVRQFPGITSLYELCAVMREAFSAETCRLPFDARHPERGHDDVASRLVHDMCGLDTLRLDTSSGPLWGNCLEGEWLDVTGGENAPDLSQVPSECDACAEPDGYARYRGFQRGIIRVLAS